MTKKQLNELKAINAEQSQIIENRISSEYKQSKRVGIADGVSVFLYYLGYVILITFPFNMITLSNSGKRTYKWNWLWSLLGLNLLFFLYIGEQRRYDKYFEKELEKVEVHELMNEEFRKGYDRVNNLTENQIDNFRINHLYTTDNFEQSFTPLGMVYGSSVRAKNATSDIGAGIRNLKGGKIEVYTKLMNETRSDALDTLIINATKNYEDFDAICNIRMSTSNVAGGASEVMVYGTVIKFN